MTAETIEERVRAIVRDHLGAQDSDVRPDSHLIADLGADSLDTVEMVMEFEEEFDVLISDADVEAVSTVADAAAMIARLTEKEGVAA